MLVRQGLCGLAALLSSNIGDNPTDIFAPAGTPAHSIFGLSMLVLGITGSIFLIVGGMLLYVLVRYRSRTSDSAHEQEPPQIYGSNQIELSWTVIPTLIVVMLFLATARVIYTTEHAPKPTNALEVTVVGHQFWWEYRYPALGIVSANELHVPVSDKKHPLPTYLTMTSADTDHSFWVPRLAGKMDLIPNKVNTMWIDPQTSGIYLGQCAQYCGVQHAKMLIRVYADTPTEFAAWVAHQQQPAVEDPSVAEGRAVFEQNACISCHTIRGTVATGRFGPDLTHVASRDTIASGSVPNTEANLHSFVDNPAHFKPGALMPPMHLDSHDLDAVTAYLTTLK
jgi:cytochrome c oxidase subunit 2